MKGELSEIQLNLIHVVSLAASEDEALTPAQIAERLGFRPGMAREARAARNANAGRVMSPVVHVTFPLRSLVDRRLLTRSVSGVYSLTDAGSRVAAVVAHAKETGRRTTPWSYPLRTIQATFALVQAHADGPMTTESVHERDDAATSVRSTGRALSHALSGGLIGGLSDRGVWWPTEGTYETFSPPALALSYDDLAARHG